MRTSRAPPASTSALALDMGGTSCDVCLSSTASRSTRPTSSSSSASRSACRASRRGRSAPAAARSAGSTRAASSRSGRRAPAPLPGPPATARAGRRRRSPTPTSCSAASTRPSSSAATCRSTRRSRSRRSSRSAARLGTRTRSTPPQRWCASATRTWRTRSASSPSSRARTRASTRWSRSAAPARRTPARSPTRSASATCSCRLRPGLCSAFGALAARRQDRRRPQRLPHRRAHDRRPRSAASSPSSRSRRVPTSRPRALGEEPTVRRLAAMRYQGQNYEQEVPFAGRRRSTTPALRDAYERLRRSLRGVLRLPPRRDPDRARPAGRRSRWARPPAFGRLPGDAASRPRPRHGERDVFFPAAGLRRRRGSCAARRSGRGRAGRARDRRVHGLDRSSSRPDWTLRAREDGILEVTR